LLVQILIIFGTVILNGVFAMAEIALVSSRRARLQQRADEGDKGAAAALELMRKPNRFLSTVQVGITLVGIFAGAYGGAQLSEPLGRVLGRIDFLAPYADAVAFALVVLLITYFSLVIGELLPKRLALNSPENVSAALAIPMRFLSRLAKPIVNLLSTSTEIGVRLLGVKPSTDPPITEEEIKVLIEQGRQVGIFEDAERDMVSGVFRLGERRVDALMTPRTEMSWIDINEAMRDIWQQILRSPHARIPIADGDLDKVLGYIQVRDLLGQDPEDPDFDLRTFVLVPLYVPENMAALKVLDNYQTSGVHLALVIDEFGGITGMVTEYDILEAIVGDIPEDSEDTDQLAVQREDGSWLFDGLIVVDQLKEILGISDMPGEERAAYQTLSGFVMSQLGRIPKTGAKFTYEEYTFEVMDMDGRRVDRVLVSQRDMGED
jgi:putative hemolysin